VVHIEGTFKSGVLAVDGDGREVGEAVFPEA
jgi:hypothetical protein